MDEIKWLEVAVNTTPDRLDQVCAKLAAAGNHYRASHGKMEYFSVIFSQRRTPTFRSN